MPNTSLLDVVAGHHAWVDQWSEKSLETARRKLGSCACDGCRIGGCCRQPVIATYLDALLPALRLHQAGLNLPRLRQEFAKRGELMEVALERGAESEWSDQCVFLKDNECTVYDVRPTMCRAYWVFEGSDRCVPLALGGTREKVCMLDNNEPIARSLELVMRVAEELGHARKPYIRALPLAVVGVLEALDGPPEAFWETVLSLCAMPAWRFEKVVAMQEGNASDRVTL